MRCFPIMTSAANADRGTPCRCPWVRPQLV